MAVELRSICLNVNKKRANDNSNKNPPEKKSKGVNELKEFTAQEITRLSDEIFHLKEEICQKESVCADKYALETLQRIAADVCGGEDCTDLPCSSPDKSLRKTVEEIALLNKRLNSLETFTGITFDENTVSVLSRTDRTSLFLRRLSGTCRRIPFSVEFEVKEDEQNRDAEELAPSPPVIIKLKASITHPLSEQELANFINSVEQEKALQPFFIGLMQYADWCCHRQRTFHHFKTKYPDFVHIIGGSARSVSMQLCNTNKPGLLFTVYWKLEISCSGVVVPDFQIHVFAPLKRTDSKEKRSLVEAVPQQFRSVLPLLGIEQSIEVVLGMIRE